MSRPAFELTDEQKASLRNMLDQIPTEGEARRLYLAVERIVTERNAKVWASGYNYGFADGRESVYGYTLNPYLES